MHKGRRSQSLQAITCLLRTWGSRAPEAAEESLVAVEPPVGAVVVLDE